MISRLASLLLLAVPGGVATLAAGGEETFSTVTVAWSSEARGPGVCIDRGTWFVSVIPASVPLSGLTETTLHSGENSVRAKVLFLDGPQRLCLLETSTILPGLAPVTLASSGGFKAGQKLNCLSNRSACLTMLAGKDWSHRGEQFLMPMLRVRVADPEEFCAAGTPLVCDEGTLVGILTGKNDEDKESGEVHAIPVSRIRKLVEDMKAHQRSGPVRVGLVFHNQSSTPEIVEVKPGSPAEKSGLEVGDVILSMDGVETDSLEDLVEVIHSLPAGAETPVKVLRRLTEKNLTITPEFVEVSASAR
jgi:hypothetical protein